ncbi:glycoside hydrolase family 2 TIM barrel-domain containing protein [Saccharicrinis aurantiacus]|uniref:glycoside hydrolase family 2 TIM barrel-domain containing protein n=1 Tax=Saccharicrinis aurantiacus TaxID=1849719 RepID=UPI00094FDDDE|nr:glycoside hydrolase family 2 TIM barrel-domain containing protein [Saccharicrinis aurantiacus]
MRQLLFFAALCLCINISAQHINFNEDWRFSLGDENGWEQSNYNDASWRQLDLPHDWSIEGEYSKDNPMAHFCGYLPAGIGWYRKTITVPQEWKGKHIEIAFDGVFMNSTVWANGRKLGDRPYGWVSFAYDISEEVAKSNTISFAVRVDNDKQPSARWYTGSGIYANTWINVKENIYVPKSGICIRTEGNVVSIDTELFNKTEKGSKITLVSSIKDANGKVVASANAKLKLESKQQSVEKQVLTIENPMLWDTDNPYLYTLQTEVKQGKQVLDVVNTPFGVRDIKWIPETGMWLNGKNVKLQGVCNHADAGALGVAVPDKIRRFRIQQMKDMGVNSIRTSHYPRPPEFYDLCDEMGMLVMDEIFDGWHRKAENDYGAHSFDEWWKQDMTDWLKRDRNHPSIVIYSVGNETHGDIAPELVATCHDLDPTRPVTSGHSNSEDMDVFGVNGSSEMKGFIENEVSKDKVFIGTENTHTLQVRGYYRTKTWYRNGYPNEKRRPHYYPDLTEEEVFTHDWAPDSEKVNSKQIFLSSYDNATIRLNSRHNVEKLRDIPYFAGSYRWTGYDYLGETKYHGGWPFKALSSGAVDIANFEKDLYYMYQSQWTSKPMAHILPHWTHPTIKEGTEIPVWVYSNCDEVELFFNDQSLGKIKPGKTWDTMNCQWLVPWKPGTIKAVAYKNGKATVTKTMTTANAPAKIALSIDGAPMANKKKDLVQVRVTTTDAKGTMYPYGENRTYFKVFGSAYIKALDNGSPMDVEQHYLAQSRNAFYGLSRAYVEATDAAGSINLLAASILGEKKQITSNKVSINAQMLNIRGDKVNPNIQVYYTTDGSQPTTKSSKYKNSFEVALGTTVKALVVADGEALYVMEERFAMDEGFIFDAEVGEMVEAGDQAEDAKLVNAVVQNKGKGFNGQSYVFMGKQEGGSVEWYYENDGAAGQFNFKIRYSASDMLRGEYKIILNINGVEQKMTLPTTKDYQNNWEIIGATENLKAGANTIKITTLQGDGLCIDEIRVY